MSAPSSDAPGAMCMGRRPTYEYGSELEITAYGPVPHRVAVDVEPDARRAVVVAEPGGERRRCERGVSEVALHRRSDLHAPDDGGVEADPEVEQEVTWVGLEGRARCGRDAEADAPARIARQRVDELLGRGLRVVRDAERAREHVGRTAGERRERHLRSGEPTTGLVQRAVTREHGDDVVAGGHRVAVRSAPHGRAARSRRRRDRVRATQDALDVGTHARRDRGRGGVHHEEDAHGGEPYPDPVARPAALRALDREIVECRACPRLVEWREQVAVEKRASFRADDVLGSTGARFRRPRGPRAGGRAWHRPRTGPTAPAGCSPATGRATASTRRCTAPGSPTRRRRCRPTTGSSCATLYVTAAVRCAPPANKPTPEERDTCLPYLVRELELLDRVRVIVVLGAFAYDAVARVCAAAGSPLPAPRPRFAHGVEVPTARARCSAASTRRSRTRSPASSPSP